MGAPDAPATARDRRSPPRERMASSVPSPPSAIGHCLASTSGQTRAMPCAIACAASAADADPLKESGAMTTMVRRVTAGAYDASGSKRRRWYQACKAFHALPIGVVSGRGVGVRILTFARCVERACRARLCARGSMGGRGRAGDGRWRSRVRVDAVAPARAGALDRGAVRQGQRRSRPWTGCASRLGPHRRPAHTPRRRGLLHAVSADAGARRRCAA